MIFLRFPDEQTYLEIASSYLDEEGNLTLPDVSVIGIIYEGGEYDEEGNVVIPPTKKQGFHVNMLGEVPPEFTPYIIERPSKPYRIFAGH